MIPAHASAFETVPNSWVAAVAAAITLAGFTLAGGPLGLAAAGLVLATWYALGDVFGFATGHLALAALSPSTLTAALLVAEAGLIVGLLAHLATPPRPSRTIIGFVAAAAVVGGIAVATRTWTSSPVASALAVATATALLAYGLHRYELVRLSLVEVSP